jgi:hypothetical protein
MLCISGNQQQQQQLVVTSTSTVTSIVVTQVCDIVPVTVPLLVEAYGSIIVPHLVVLVPERNVAYY